MNLPTQHQMAVAGTALATSAASVVATLGFVHLLNPADAANATAAISQIGDGVAKIAAGTGTLVTIGAGVYATVSSNPIWSFLRSSKAIAASPELTQQIQAAPLVDKAPLVAITDKLPEVARVPTTNNDAGRALAAAVPSNTVQPDGSNITTSKVAS